MKFNRVSGPESELESITITDEDEVYIICAMISHFSTAPVGEFPAAIAGWGRSIDNIDLNGAEQIALNKLSEEASENTDVWQPYEEKDR